MFWKHHWNILSRVKIQEADNFECIILKNFPFEIPQGQVERAEA